MNRPLFVGAMGAVIVGAAIALTMYFEFEPGARPKSGPSASAPVAAERVAPVAAPPEQAPAETGSRLAAPEISKEPIRPSFDVVRVNREGDAVIAGRAEPHAEVTVTDGEREIGKVKADSRGEWVLVPSESLPAGPHELSLEAKSKPRKGKQDKPAVLSRRKVILVVPERGKDIAGRETTKPSGPLVMVVPRDDIGPTTVLQRPETPLRPTPTVREARPRPKPDGAPATPPAVVAERAVEVAEAEKPAARRPRDPAATLSQVAPAAGRPDVGMPSRAADAAAPPRAADAAAPPRAADAAAPPQVADAAAPPRVADAATPPRVTDAAAPPRVADAAAPPRAADAATPPRAADAAAPPRAADAGAPPRAEQPRQRGLLGIPQRPGGPVQMAALGQADDPLTSVLSLDAIDYDEAGNISMSGQAPEGARVRIYLDNRPIGDATTGAAGVWLLAPSISVPPGLYRMRVDQIDRAGRVVARIETPFSRAGPMGDLPRDAVVFVQPGNSLWRIARRNYGKGVRYTVIYEANRDQIRNPDLIYPGQIFVVPKVN